MRARVFAVMALAALPLGALAASAEQGQAQTRFRGMDRNGDGRITRAEWRGSAQSFRQHDWNADGVLSGDEVRPGGRGSAQDDTYGNTAPEFDDWTDEGFRYLDRNRDGRLTRNEWDYDRASFVRADRNQDNVLTRAEFLGSAEVNPDPNRSDRFEYLDTNNNNRVERSEWPDSRTAFNSLDRNGDGVLSRAEVAATDTTAPDERFATLDRNRDGRLSRSEWTDDRAAFLRADSNGDNMVTRTEFLAMETPREERFESLDTNNNGRIERREWRGRADRFDTLDRNNDGAVTRNEMLGTADEAESELFAAADQNRDNRLSQSEWQWAQRVFTQQDTNRDGYVSREEFLSPGARSVAGTGGFANNRTVNSPVVVQVNGNQRWVDTGLDTRVGDVLRISSTGTVRLSGGNSDAAGPGGANRRADNAPMPNHPAGALIGRISNGQPFFIGDGTNIQTVTAAGRLYLSVNDDHLDDNSGAFRVTIVIRPQ